MLKLALVIKVYFSEARCVNLKRCFNDLVELTESTNGVHPRLAMILDSVFAPIEAVEGEIGTFKRHRVSQRTWKDNTSITMWLD
jgi:hypothetical protein